MISSRVDLEGSLLACCQSRNTRRKRLSRNGNGRTIRHFGNFLPDDQRCSGVRVWCRWERQSLAELVTVNLKSDLEDNTLSDSTSQQSTTHSITTSSIIDRRNPSISFTSNTTHVYLIHRSRHHLQPPHPQRRPSHQSTPPYYPLTKKTVVVVPKPMRPKDPLI